MTSSDDAPVEQPAKPKVKPWRWPIEWWHDEKFWRETATRTVAGALVVILGFIYARTAGYITAPDTGNDFYWDATNVVANVAVFVVLGSFIVMFFSKNATQVHKGVREE